jgi:hypothetical protein
MWGFSDYVTPIATGWMRSTGQETVLAFIKKSAPKPYMRLTPHVTLNETILGRKPLIAALDQFASAANAIIDLFDD